MGLHLEVLSEPKGGNPGGFCSVLSPEVKSFRGYFKYCIGKRNLGASSLTHQNQPIYEAITIELARKLGLLTIDYYVVLNKKKDVQFHSHGEYSNLNPAGRSLYFLSKVLSRTNVQLLDNLESVLIDEDEPYLNTLLIADIIGRRPNFDFVMHNGKPRVTYIDLGCSFVHATEGYLSQKNKLKLFSEKEFKHTLKYLKGQNIILSNGSLVGLEYLLDEFNNLNIKCLNPNINLKLSDLLSSDEISEIKSYVLQGILFSLPKLKEKGLILRE